MEYRFMIYNELMKEYQFPSICETTEKGARTCLFNAIGNDARKYRFTIVKVEKEKAKELITEMKMINKAKRIHRIISNIPFNEILELVRRDKWKY